MKIQYGCNWDERTLLGHRDTDTTGLRFKRTHNFFTWESQAETWARTDQESSRVGKILGYGLGHRRSGRKRTIGSDTDGVGLTGSHFQWLIYVIQWPEMTRFENRKRSNDFWSGLLVHIVWTSLHKASSMSENSESEFGVLVALVL